MKCTSKQVKLITQESHLQCCLRPINYCFRAKLWLLQACPRVSQFRTFIINQKEILSLHWNITSAHENKIQTRKIACTCAQDSGQELLHLSVCIARLRKQDEDTSPCSGSLSIVCCNLAADFSTRLLPDQNCKRCFWRRLPPQRGLHPEG